MQNGKKSILKNVVFAIVFAISLVTVPFYTVKADDDVKPKKVSLKTNKITVTAGQEFELKAKLTPDDADEDYLVWSIVKGKKVIAFGEDDDRYGDDEVEFKALKKGTAKVKVKIKGTNKVAYATITVKAKNTGTIKRVGAKKRTVEVGDDFELEVKKSSGVKDKHLKWTISNRKIVKFDDDDKYGDEVEFKAKKTGTVTITCTNTKTKKKVVYKITVVRDDDDDDDDDDD